MYCVVILKIEWSKNSEKPVIASVDTILWYFILIAEIVIPRINIRNNSIFDQVVTRKTNMFGGIISNLSLKPNESS